MKDRRSRGAVFTPPAIGRKLAEMALAGRVTPNSVCDPAAGDGRLLGQIAALTGNKTNLFAADIFHPSWLDGSDEDGEIIADCDFYHGNSLLAGLDAWQDAPEAGFDLVIGNPPFRNQLERRTWLETSERAALKERFGAVASLYADTASMFLVHATQIAAPGGRVAMIMPLSFLTVRDAQPARQRVLELADLVGLWVANAQVFPTATVQVCAIILDRKPLTCPTVVSNGAADLHTVFPRHDTTAVDNEVDTAVDDKPSDPVERSTWVRRWSGEAWSKADAIEVDQASLREAATWGHLVSDLVHNTPRSTLKTAGLLGHLASATAGFRRQFYGLAPHVFEAPSELIHENSHGGSFKPCHPLATTGLREVPLPVITSGLIEPGRVLWGERSTRIAGHTWQAPALLAGSVADDGSLLRWLEARLVAKIVLATQTPVLEAAPDLSGHWVPSTPVIAVHVVPERLWHVLAVLLSPPASWWAASTYAGAALSVNAIKVSASQVEQIPLPGDSEQWDCAALMLADAYEGSLAGCNMAAIVDAAKIMTEAYAASPKVFDWWYDRIAPKLDG